MKSNFYLSAIDFGQAQQTSWHSRAFKGDAQVDVSKQHKPLIIILLLMFFLLNKGSLFAQCNPDIQPPTAVCNFNLQVEITGGNSQVEIPASAFDAVSSDNCTAWADLDFFIELAPASPTLPGTTSLTVGSGQYTCVLWVVDAAGNSSICWGSLNVVQGCTSDNVPPVALCKASTTISLPGGEVTLPATALNNGSYDNCIGSLAFFIEESPASALPPATSSHTFTVADAGENEMVLWVLDQAGNAASCLSNVTVDTCFHAPILVCNDQIEIEINGPDPVLVYPLDVLEGGPYCAHQLAIGELPGGTPLPFLEFTSNDVGIHTVVVTNQLTNGNCWGSIEIISNCLFENTPPVAVCDQSLTVQLSMDGPDLTYVHASDPNEGSYDNCTATPNLVFAIETAPASPSMPSSTSLAFTALGTYPNVLMWVADLAGNTSICWTEVNVIPPKCQPDQTPPALVAPADTVVSSDDLAAMNLDPNVPSQYNQYFGEAYAYDFCGLYTLNLSVSIVTNACNFPTIITRHFVVIDEAGNERTATQTIQVQHDFSINIPKDFLPGDTGNPQVLSINSGNNNFSISNDNELFDFNCDSIPDMIIVYWHFINWCDTYIPGQPEIDLPRLDLDNDGNIGDAYMAQGLPDSVYLLENGLPVLTLTNSGSIFNYTQIIRYNYDDTTYHSLAGTVFFDTIANCLPDPSEFGLSGWTVKAVGLTTGTVYSTTTTANGLYEINGICGVDTELEVSLDVPFNYGQTCQTTWTVNTIPGMPAVLFIPVQLDDDCALMEVDLATPFLRRCFPNTYTVNYCNYSTSPIPDVWVEVSLDSFMDFQNASLPHTYLGNNRYSFSVGNLAPGQCGGFSIDFNLSCEATLGQTHCTEAFIYPDTLCPQLASWSGANIQVEANCVNDEVQFSIHNTGFGDMEAPLDFIVVEDVIMYMEGNFDLDAGQSLTFAPIAANGATWRLEAAQANGHPFPGNVAVALEGCDGINYLGLVNLFSVENPNPFVAVDCRENIGSFDPNDKLAFPTGYGPEHYIERNTDIEYMIRFQNTGTDTAFNVVVLDKLSDHLDPTSIRPGASSHPYSFELLDGKIIRFTFKDIMLPDSNTNLAASQGFIHFSAKQKPALPIGSVIENTAAIYFDFNEPIITNTVFHTIGERFIEVINDAHESLNAYGKPLTFPNPVSGTVTFALPEALPDGSRFVLYNLFGQAVSQAPATGKRFIFDAEMLPSGTYFYAFENNGEKWYSGKVVRR